MDFDSKEIKTTVRELKAIDSELAYLALLTCEGVKPLSRWEKPLDSQGLGLLQRLGLLMKQIRRTVKTGRVVTETVFGLSPAYIQLYERRFNDTPIDKSPPTQRFEGFLFGFPPCCVDEYIRHPYTKNNLPPEQQKILFHWACKDCKITPALLPQYVCIHEYVEKC
ncbi:MAG: hypothetical protein JSV99_02460 [Planctomycetota bacterium]|nr:MAG: hypothetical protein JSV99_02460 [Planctomycetota bacterium]